jgi:hypothetical protein
VQRVIDLYPGVFDAVVSDSTTSYRQMREVIAAANPGTASINGQAHAANLLASDLGKTSFLKNPIKDASVVAKYVRNHYRLTFAYQKATDKYNANEIAPAERLFKSAKRYPQPNAARFLCVRDLLVTPARKFCPFRAVLETWGGVQELVRAQRTVAKEAQSEFLAVAQSQFSQKDFAVAAHCQARCASIFASLTASFLSFTSCAAVMYILLNVVTRFGFVYMCASGCDQRSADSLQRIAY